MGCCVCEATEMTLLGHVLIHFTENFACVKVCVCMYVCQTIFMLLGCVEMAYRTLGNN